MKSSSDGGTSRTMGEKRQSEVKYFHLFIYFILKTIIFFPALDFILLLIKDLVKIVRDIYSGVPRRRRRCRIHVLKSRWNIIKRYYCSNCFCFRSFIQFKVLCCVSESSICIKYVLSWDHWKEVRCCAGWVRLSSWFRNNNRITPFPYQFWIPIIPPFKLGISLSSSLLISVASWLAGLLTICWLFDGLFVCLLVFHLYGNISVFSQPDISRMLLIKAKGRRRLYQRSAREEYIIDFMFSTSL